MPELPEVEILVRHLDPLLREQRIRAVEIRRDKIIAPHSRRELTAALVGGRFVGVRRRGKYLVFTLRARGRSQSRTLQLIGHLGMTGRMYLLRTGATLPKHAAAVLVLGQRQFVFEDTRYFGRLTLDGKALDQLGPEPLQDEFKVESLASGLGRSRQSIKVKLLDQTIVAGLGNIYANEALYRARISPKWPASRLSRAQVQRLWSAIRRVLREAIHFGSTVPLDWGGKAGRDRLFYYGRAASAPDYYEERLRIYDRQGEPCWACGTAIRKITQAARSTYFCPNCQK